MIRTKIIAAALSLACTATAQAEFYTGQEILDRLQSKSLIQKTLAVGYISGIFDMGQGVLWCGVPSDTTAGEVVAVVGLHLLSNRDQLHRGASVLVASAILGHFEECPKGHRKSDLM
jgi:hypothetical protein